MTSPSTEKWEYLDIPDWNSVNPRSAPIDLNTFGREGWQLVQVTPAWRDGLAEHHVPRRFTFKRPQISPEGMSCT